MTQLLFLITTAFNILCCLYWMHEASRLRQANDIMRDLVDVLKALEAKAAGSVP